VEDHESRTNHSLFLPTLNEELISKNAKFAFSQICVFALSVDQPSLVSKSLSDQVRYRRAIGPPLRLVSPPISPCSHTRKPRPAGKSGKNWFSQAQLGEFIVVWRKAHRVGTL